MRIPSPRTPVYLLSSPYKVLFREQDEPGGKYVLLQRQFEVPDGGISYFECDQIERSGSHVIRKAKLRRERFEIEVPGQRGGQWMVGFRIDDRRYTALKEVLRIILGKPSRIEIEG